MSSEVTGASTESRDLSVASSGSPQGSPSVTVGPPNLSLSAQSSSPNLEPRPTVVSQSAPAIDAHSLAAVAQLAPDIDGGVDAWPCTHCAQRHANFHKWAADREISKKDNALRRAREMLMKLPEVKTAFPLDRSRFPISRKYGKRCREVYKSCYSEWMYLHERKPNLKPAEPDMNRPLSPDDFKYYSGASSPDSPPSAASPQPPKGSPQAVNCAVAKDAHRRYPIYVSKASSSGSDNVSVRPGHTKPRSPSIASPRSELSAARMRSIRAAAFRSISANSPRSGSPQNSTKTEESPKAPPSDGPRNRDSSNLLQPPSPTSRKKKPSPTAGDTKEKDRDVTSKKTKGLGKLKKRKKKMEKLPNRWPDCCKAAQCKDASMCMCEDYEWATRRGKNRIPTPQCWCEYYEMLKEIYQMMNDEIKRKKMLVQERKERKALEAEVRCKVLQEEKALRLKRLRKRKKARSTAKLHIESEGAAAHPKFPCAPWMQKLAREIAISEACFENPNFRNGKSTTQEPEKAPKPLVPLETDDHITSVLKELALVLKHDPAPPAATPTLPRPEPPRKRNFSLSHPISIEQAPQTPTSVRSVHSKPSTPKAVEPPPNLIGGDELLGTDYLVSGTPISLPQTPVPSPPRATPLQASPRREEPQKATMVQYNPPQQQLRASAKWQIKGGGRSTSPSQPTVMRSYGIASSQPVSTPTLINYKLTRGPQRDQLQRPNRFPQSFSSQAHHARAVLTPSEVSPVSADEGPVIPSPSITESMPTAINTPATGEVAQLQSMPTAINTPATGEVVQLQAHPSYVGYDVPSFSTPVPSRHGAGKSTQPTAFTIVEPSSFPESGFNRDSGQYIRHAGADGTGQEEAFRLVTPVELAASMGEDGDYTSSARESRMGVGYDVPPPRILVTRGDDKSEVEVEMHDYHHFEPHGDFFYLRNLGEGVKFYRRQIFKNVARKKKRSRTTR